VAMGDADPVDPAYEPQEGSPAESLSDTVTGVFAWFSDRPMFLWILAAVSAVVVLVVVLAKVRKGLTLDRWTLLSSGSRFVVSAGAVTAAWGVADLLGSGAPVFAGMGALVTAQVAVRGSWKTALQTVAGSILALALAEVLISYFGFGLLPLAAIIVISLGIGKVIAGDGVWVATTVLFASALGPALTDVAVSDRMMSTVVGVAIGAILSPLAHPWWFNYRLANERLATLSSEISATLLYCSSLGRIYDSIKDGSLVASTERIDDAVDDTEEAVEQAYEASTPKAKGDDLRKRTRALIYCAARAKGIADALTEASTRGTPIPADVFEAVSATEALLEAFSAGRSGEEVERLSENLSVATTFAARSVKNDGNTSAVILGGAVLGELDAMRVEIPSHARNP
jgi:uncharacterized membrane protein YgaE (UPF0421/DUF939 family)